MSKEREALKLTLTALKQIDEAMPFPVAKLAIMKAEEALMSQSDGTQPELRHSDECIKNKWQICSCGVEMQRKS